MIRTNTNYYKLVTNLFGVVGPLRSICVLLIVPVVADALLRLVVVGTMKKIRTYFQRLKSGRGGGASPSSSFEPMQVSVQVESEGGMGIPPPPAPLNFNMPVAMSVDLPPGPESPGSGRSKRLVIANNPEEVSEMLVRCLGARPSHARMRKVKFPPPRN